jgi:sulfatase modifying factor 1
VQGGPGVRGFVLAAALAACAAPERPGLDTSAGSYPGGSSRPTDGPERDAGGAPSSCLGGGVGVASCGEGSESCCTTLEVNGGSYYRTYANDGGGAVGGGNAATVSSFRLDEFDVTVGRFRRFVGAAVAPDGGTGWRPPAGAGKHTHLNGGRGLGWSGTYDNETGWLSSDDGLVAPTDANLACDVVATWTALPEGNENLPITCLNWYEAYAFCIWDGAFLPSEAEWEYASAGGIEEREYPWGSAAPGTANQYAIYDSFYVGSPDGERGVIAPVGTATLGAGRWGQLDLVGNVAVWNLDWHFSPSYFDPCVDCAYLTARAHAGRVARGGAFFEDASHLVTSNRQDGIAPAVRSKSLGVRCARAL